MKLWQDYKNKQTNITSYIVLVDQIPRNIHVNYDHRREYHLTLYDLQTNPIRSFSACFSISSVCSPLSVIQGTY